MYKSQIITSVLESVSRETEISIPQILSPCRIRDIVDARFMSIKLLHDAGIYPLNIARTFNITPRSVNYAVTTFDDRMSTNRMLMNSYRRLKQACAGLLM